MKNYLEYVCALERARALADHICAERIAPPVYCDTAPDAPCVLLFSPHPDDESITGAWPLRLRKEKGWRIINVPITCGSRPERRMERAEETRKACSFLGFDTVFPAENGFKLIRPEMREHKQEAWHSAIKAIACLLNKYKPLAVFTPHSCDFNTTHTGTHHLISEALSHAEHMPEYVVETEYWYPMATPNILVESSQEDVAELISAVALHTKEVARNPYHLSLPAWMQDTVRRGSEYLSGQGFPSCGFSFGTLYRIKRRDGSTFVPYTPVCPFCGTSSDPALIH